MRLEEIYQICKKNQHILRSYIKNIAGCSSNQKAISKTKYEMCKTSFCEAKEAIIDLNQLPFLQEDIKNIDLDQEFDPKKSLLQDGKIYDKISVIISMCETLGYNSLYEKNGFAVKLPAETDFATFAKCINDFQLILSQCPFFKVENASVSFRKMDVGSTWLEFVVNGSAAAALLGIFVNVIDKSLILWSHMKTVKQQEEILQSAKLDNQLLETIIGNYETVSNALKEQYINELSKEELDEEDRDRAKLCLDKLVAWFDKGLEIHNMIECDREITPIFPTTERWAGIKENALKFLGDKDNKKE